MKNAAFTFIELVVVLMIIAILSATIGGALSIYRNSNKAEISIKSPLEENERMLRLSDVRKEFEIKGYDIYTFSSYGKTFAVAIPTTNSVYDLERK